MPAQIEACVERLKDKPGIDNPDAICNWMKAQGIRLPGADAQGADVELRAIVDQYERARRPHEHGDLKAVKVDRSQSGWIVLRDAVATREGVWNGAYRPWASIAATYKRLEGKPLILEDHRFFTEARVTLGQARHLRKDEAKHRVLYDGWLYADTALEGYQVDELAVFFNRALARSVEAGRPVHNSIGYASRDEAQAGTWKGIPYQSIRHHEDYEHIAILPTKLGACPTEAGCGLGVDVQAPPDDVLDAFRAAGVVPVTGLTRAQLWQISRRAQPVRAGIVQRVLRRLRA